MEKKFATEYSYLYELLPTFLHSGKNTVKMIIFNLKIFNIQIQNTFIKTRAELWKEKLQKSSIHS